MLDLKRFSQGSPPAKVVDVMKEVNRGKKENKENKENKEIILNMGNTEEIGTRSSNKKKELAGNFNLVIINDRLEIELIEKMKGGIASVDVPDRGNTFHTHPRQCPSRNNCSIIPPSAQDMKIFAERWNEQHMVITKERVYWIKARKEYTQKEADIICEFYEILERHFDDNSYKHEDFDELYTLVCRMGNFFTIFKFKNKGNIKLSSNS